MCLDGSTLWEARADGGVRWMHGLAWRGFPHVVMKRLRTQPHPVHGLRGRSGNLPRRSPTGHRQCWRHRRPPSAGGFAVVARRPSTPHRGYRTTGPRPGTPSPRGQPIRHRAAGNLPPPARARWPASTPMCAFMPKNHWFPFRVWCPMEDACPSGSSSSSGHGQWWRRSACPGGPSGHAPRAPR